MAQGPPGPLNFVCPREKQARTSLKLMNCSACLSGRKRKRSLAEQTRNSPSGYKGSQPRSCRLGFIWVGGRQLPGVWPGGPSSHKLVPSGKFVFVGPACSLLPQLDVSHTRWREWRADSRGSYCTPSSTLPGRGKGLGQKEGWAWRGWTWRKGDPGAWCKNPLWRKRQK